MACNNETLINKNAIIKHEKVFKEITILDMRNKYLNPIWQMWKYSFHDIIVHMPLVYYYIPISIQRILV